MSVDRDDQEERVARIDMLLDELRLNTEDMRELAKQAKERAKQSREQSRSGFEVARSRADRKR
jgi:hypothetical protein